LVCKLIRCHLLHIPKTAVSNQKVHVQGRQIGAIRLLH